MVSQADRQPSFHDILDTFDSFVKNTHKPSCLICQEQCEYIWQPFPSNFLIFLFLALIEFICWQPKEVLTAQFSTCGCCGQRKTSAKRFLKN